MWALEALGEIPLKKQLSWMIAMLGAEFLLLATVFSIQPLYHPATYAVLILSVWLSQSRQSIRKLLLSAILISAACFLLVPGYLIPFSLAAALLIGRCYFAETYRHWKWLASSSMIYVSLLVAASWQNIPLLHMALPPIAHPFIHGAIFSFCACVSLLPLAVSKNAVLDTFEAYRWKPNSESARMASRIVALYGELKMTFDWSPEKKKELADHTARMIDFCHELHCIEEDLNRISLFRLDEEIRDLSERIAETKDGTARIQYEQALRNKEKQKEQHEALQMRKERIQARLLHYISALENIRFASTNYSGREHKAESIDFFLDILKAEV